MDAELKLKSRLQMKLNYFSKTYFIILVTIVLFAVFSFVSRPFSSLENIMNILRQSSMTSIVAVGSFFILVAGGIDISSGSVVGLVGIISSMMLTKLGLSLWIALPVGIAAGCICGLLNGWLVTARKVPPFIATLGTMGAIRGLTYVITNSYPIRITDDSIEFIGRGNIGLLPVPVILMVIIYGLAYVLAEKTKLGRFIFAVGGNENASYLSGVNAKKIKMITYIIGSFTASIASIVLLSRLNSGQPEAGTGFEFEAITAAVIGGTSLNGGKGKIIGVLFGSLFIAILFNGMVILNINSYFQQMLKAIVLVLAVMIDSARKK